MTDSSTFWVEHDKYKSDKTKYKMASNNKSSGPCSSAGNPWPRSSDTDEIQICEVMPLQSTLRSRDTSTLPTLVVSPIAGPPSEKKGKLEEVANSHSITTSEMDMTGCVGGGILELGGQNKQLTESLDEQKACIEELERLVQN